MPLPVAGFGLYPRYKLALVSSPLGMPRFDGRSLLPSSVAAASECYPPDNFCALAVTVERCPPSRDGDPPQSVGRVLWRPCQTAGTARRPDASVFAIYRIALNLRAIRYTMAFDPVSGI
jgi:hypothetical protein